MGKASSSKKVARAKRAAGRPGAKKSYIWPVTIGAVVLVGVLLVVLSATSRDDASATPPLLNDHWHAAYGIYDCDGFIPSLNDVAPDESGIHTHGDGLMHMHPFGSRYTGDGANIGNWGETVGLELTDDSVQAAGIDRSNGDSCGDEEGVVQLWAWDGPTDTEPERIQGDLADYDPDDQSMFVIAFAPEGTEIPPPPDAVNLQDPTAAERGEPTPSEQGGSSTTVPGDTSTTVAADPNASTTVPPDSSTTTTAAP